MQLIMVVKGLLLDPTTQTPILILKGQEEDSRLLPIWIGMFEANAIASELEHVTAARPMTHDLLKKVVNAVDGVVTKMVISDLKEHTYYAVIHLLVNGRPIEVDARPSDAIAVALRSEAPIFVEEEVLTKAQLLDSAEAEADKLKKWLEELGPEDLGNYQM